MHINETTLSNNIKVITNETGGSSAVIGAFVDAGTRHENEDENGVAHMLEHMNFKGTKKRTSYEISQQIEILGAHINAYTDYDMTAFYVKGLPEHISIAGDIVGDILSNSKYDEKDINLESGVILR